MTVTAKGEQGRDCCSPTQAAETTDKVEGRPQVSHEGLSKVEGGSNQVPAKVTKKPVAETHLAKQPVSAQVADEGISLDKEESPVAPKGLSPSKKGSTVDDKVSVQASPAPAETHSVKHQSAQAAKTPAKKQVADLKEPTFSQMAHYIQMRQQLDTQMRNCLPLEDLLIFQQIKSDIEKLFHTEKINFHVENVDVSKLQIGEQKSVLEAKTNFKQVFDSDKNQEIHEL